MIMYDVEMACSCYQYRNQKSESCDQRKDPNCAKICKKLNGDDDVRTYSHFCVHLSNPKRSCLGQ